MRPKTLTADQLACLASPARNEVFMQLRLSDKASIGDLARTLGKRPEAIHYHVKALEKVGLAKEAFKRRSAKKPESVYKAVGKAWRLPKMSRGSKTAEVTRKSVAAGFRQSARGYLKAAEQAEFELTIRKRMHVIRMNMRLASKDVPVVLEMIEQIVRYADEHRDEKGERLVWSSLVYPPS